MVNSYLYLLAPQGTTFLDFIAHRVQHSHHLVSCVALLDCTRPLPPPPPPPVQTQQLRRDPAASTKWFTPWTEHRFLRHDVRRPFRADIYPGRSLICYDLARVAGVGAVQPARATVGHFSWVGCALLVHRSSTASQNGRSISTPSTSWFSSVSPQISSAKNAACNGNSNVTYQGIWYHADRHEQWKRVTPPVFFFFVEEPRTGASTENVSGPITGLKRGH